MKTRLILAAAFASLAMPVFAQDAAEPPAAPAPETAAAEAPAAPVVRTVGEFGAWKVNCGEVEAGREACAVQQVIAITDEENGPSLTLFVEQAANDSISLTVLTPAQVAIKPGVSLIQNESDKAPIWFAEYESCLATGCLATGSVNVNVLAAGETPAVVFSLPTYELIGVKVASAGLLDAVAALPKPVTPEAPVAPAEATPAPEAPAAAE